MITAIKRPEHIASALYNITADSGASNDYCKGMVIGILSGLMATGKSYDQARAIIRDNLPVVSREIMRERTPMGIV